MADVYVLRHLVQAEGLSRREVARKLGISRNTVAHYLDDTVVPGKRVEPAARAKPAQDALHGPVVEILQTARVTQKQRLTAERVVDLLAAKGHPGAAVRTVRRIMAEHRRKGAEVFVPLEYPPGQLAEVDFFEIQSVVDGRQGKAFLFVLRMMHSGRDFAWIYPFQDQAAFLDGHVRAFAHFGVVPHRILYDNLRAAIRKFVGCERVLTERFAALAAHYRFACRFARPRTGHDKGGVEARGKGIRLQHLTPLPEGRSLDEISRRLMERIDGRLDRPRKRGGPPIQELWDQERAEMLPLPATAHEPGIFQEVHVDRQAQIRVRTALYSVPSGWAGLTVRVWLYADRVVAIHGGERVEHPRQPANGRRIWYPHYLAELSRKPGAVEMVGDTLFSQLGGPFQRLWRLLVDTRGTQAAARSVKALLQAVHERGAEVVAAALERAFASRGDPLLTVLQPPEPQRPAPSLPARLAGVQVQSTSLAVFRGLGGAR